MGEGGDDAGHVHDAARGAYEAVELSPLERLERDEVQLLALGVGDHLPAEIAERVARRHDWVDHV